MSEDKKEPPVKLSKADAEKAAAKERAEKAAAVEKETGLPDSFDVKNKAGKKFEVNREYYLKYQGDLTIVKDAKSDKDND